MSEERELTLLEHFKIVCILSMGFGLWIFILITALNAYENRDRFSVGQCTQWTELRKAEAWETPINDKGEVIKYQSSPHLILSVGEKYYKVATLVKHPNTIYLETERKTLTNNLDEAIECPKELQNFQEAK